MAIVTGLTAARMLAIEAASVISGAVVGNNLILTKRDTTTIDAGNVRGPTGATGPTTTLADVFANRPVASAGLNGVRFFATDKMMGWQCVAAAWVLVEVFAPEVAALPASPQDQQECIFLADVANSVKWHLRYRSASTKWEFIGGTPLYSEVIAAETTAAPAYAALTTPGPSITLPLPGDWMISQGAGISNAASGQETWMSYDIGATVASDNDKVSFSSAAALQKSVACTRTRRKTGLTAVALVSKYRVGGGTGQFQERWISATPIKLG